MRMPAHIHCPAQENIAGVRRMQRIDLRVLRAIEIVDVVALDGLIEEGESQDQDEQCNDEKFPAQKIKIAGLDAYSATGDQAPRSPIVLAK